MADVRVRITALELNDQCMTCIEQHIGLQPLTTTPNTKQTSDMIINPPNDFNLSVACAITHHGTSLTRPLNPLLPSFIPTESVVTPIPALSSATVAPCALSPSSTPDNIPSRTNASDEIQAINEKHSAIESKMNMLVASISSFIGSINTPPSSNSASTAGSK
ncbi:hypothetical protein RclHR1_01960036 [Rhizophagus clarus]|uniref:Uncharacterized protein n=1 Tax=Rhizophagus clarus TaxID=94130 RepID=A0A2Z6RI66_9GLOM|nr:hypothetical protein RclHR1_01960036 [Rhizophagus clarus]